MDGQFWKTSMDRVRSSWRWKEVSIGKFEAIETDSVVPECNLGCGGIVDDTNINSVINLKTPACETSMLWRVLNLLLTGGRRTLSTCERLVVGFVIWYSVWTPQCLECGEARADQQRERRPKADVGIPLGMLDKVGKVLVKLARIRFAGVTPIAGDLSPRQFRIRCYYVEIRGWLSWGIQPLISTGSASHNTSYQKCLQFNSVR